MFGVICVKFRCHFKVILVTFWCHFEIILVSSASRGEVGVAQRLAALGKQRRSERLAPVNATHCGHASLRGTAFRSSVAALAGERQTARMPVCIGRHILKSHGFTEAKKPAIVFFRV